MEDAFFDAAPRVLVVDDEKVIREILADFLSLEGFEVRTADDGQSALKELEGNAYDRSYPPEARFPRTLYDASERLLASQAARSSFGDAFVEHYAATRAWEEREFQKHVTDWELARYLEII